MEVFREQHIWNAYIGAARMGRYSQPPKKVLHITEHVPCVSNTFYGNHEYLVHNEVNTLYNKKKLTRSKCS
jgi:hypothetical protein